MSQATICRVGVLLCLAGWVSCTPTDDIIGINLQADGSGGRPVAAGGFAGAEPTDPYAPRAGSFKMLVYTRVELGHFVHESIIAGKAMLEQIGAEQGFEVVASETPELFTPAGLADFEIVFFLNTVGDVLDDEQQQAFETWMTKHDGAFAGVHSATDTEGNWPFYSVVTGQHVDRWAPQATGTVVWEGGKALTHPAVSGLPSPWLRQKEDWFEFDSYMDWSVKPGFRVLGRKLADGQPIVWIREWGNFRAFYTGLGHHPSAFDSADVNMKKHLTGGIMWAVRREHLIK